jgi:hypothetical protein
MNGRDRVFKRDELDEAFDKLLAIDKSEVTAVGYGALNGIRAAALLGKAIKKLDRTSTLLAIGNIVVGLGLAVIGIVQICLMLRGH